MDDKSFMELLDTLLLLTAKKELEHDVNHIAQLMIKSGGLTDKQKQLLEKEFKTNMLEEISSNFFQSEYF